MKFISLISLVTVISSLFGCAAKAPPPPKAGNTELTRAVYRGIQVVKEDPPVVQPSPSKSASSLNLPRHLAHISYSTPTGWTDNGAVPCSVVSITRFTSGDSDLALDVSVADADTFRAEVTATLDIVKEDNCKLEFYDIQETDGMALGTIICDGKVFTSVIFSFESATYRISGRWTKDKIAEDTRAIHEILASIRHSDVGHPFGANQAECQ